MKRLLLIFFTFLILCGTSNAEYFSDIIVTSPDGIWTDSRTYSTLNDAVDAVGVNKRTIVIANQKVVTSLTIPSNITLKFERDGSIANSGQLTINTKDIISDNHQIFTGTGNIDFASGSIIKSSWFSNVETAFALTSNDTLTLIISKPQIITASYSLGDNVHLQWEAPGNILTVSAGVTVGNLGKITAGDYQIFAGAGDLDFIDGTILNLNWFNSLRTIITWIESEEVNIIIPGENIVDFDLTIPTNVILDFISRHGKLSISTGITVTINSPFNSVNHQIFSCIGTGSVVLSSNSSDRIYSIWWKENIIPGTTDMSGAIQAAAKVAWISGIPLCITGIQKVDTGVVVGNTADYSPEVFEMFGLPGAKLVTANNITIFTVQGQNPELDGAGNRVQGGYIHDLVFEGNSTQGTGLKYYGVQNVRVERLNIQHFDIGMYLHNCDLISINNSFISYNVSYGIGSEGSGYATDGRLDGFWLRDSTFGHNGIGVDFAGGTSPNFIGNKFVINGTDIRLGYHALRNYVAVAPTIIGNNFESTTTYSIFLGGGGGIVRAGDISNNTFFGSSGITDILVGNVLPGQIDYPWLRIHDNLHLNTGGTKIGGYSAQVNFTDNSTVDSLPMNYTKADGNANHGRLYVSTFIIAAAATKDILKVAPHGVTTNGILYIRATKPGFVSSRMYYVNIMGDGFIVSTWTPVSSVDYSGGGVAFTVTEATIAGTTTVTINNTEVADNLLFTVRYHAVDSNATFEP